MFAAAVAIFAVRPAFGQGSLTPPGPPGPTMKSLAEIEPRTSISSLPFVITNSGSYYVTTNLTGVSGTNGITIFSSNVTLDLRGFTLAGVAGSLDGIHVITNNAPANVTVKNGTVSDWAGMGVNADGLTGGQFSQLRLANNTGDGLEPGQSAQIRNCMAINNGGDGFGGTAYKCVFETCTSTGNSGAGFYTDAECSLLNCSANENGSDGFFPYYDCTLKNCSANANLANGINVPYTGGLIVHCMTGDNVTNGIVAGNGCTVRGCSAGYNGADGIDANSGSIIESCAVYTNWIYGISVNANCQVKDCTAAFNFVGIYAANDSAITSCLANNNSQNGISVNHSCRIVSNSCQSNGSGQTGDGGIYCSGSFNRIDGNHLTENNGNGLYLGASGNTVVRNSAKSNTTNYSTGSGNDVGPIGAAASATSPWANLQ